MRILMILCLSFCIGAAIALLFLPLHFLLVAAGLLLIIGVLLCFKKEKRLRLIFLGTALGMAFSIGYQHFFVSPARSLVGQEGFFAGTALDYGQPSSRGVWTVAKLQTEAGTVRADVFLPDAAPDLKPGDRISGTFSLKDSAGDGDRYSYSEGIFLKAYGKEDVTVTPCAAVPTSSLPKWIAHRLEQSIEVCFPADIRGYAMALTTGNRSALTDLQKANLKTSGIYHALALSGMHMTVLVGMLSVLFKKRRHRALIGIPLCIAFAAVTGGSPSVIRACIMQCLLLSADATSRESDWPTSLSLALLVLVIQNPWCVLSWGLQLSFLSVIGICCLSGKIYDFLTGRRTKQVPRFVQTIAQALSVTFSAMAATFPLMLLYFGGISLISPVTNLLTGFVIMICFGGCLLTSLVGLALPGLGGIAGWVLAWGFRYVEAVAGLLSRVPFASLYTDSIYAVACLILIYGALLFALILKRKVFPVCIGASGFAVCMLLILLSSAVPSFTALDVGQGQCLVFSGAGGTVVVDCGGNEGNAGDTLTQYLMGRGIGTVDLLVLTHFDSDHSGGVSELLSRVNVKQLFYPDQTSDARTEIEAVAIKCGTEAQPITADTIVTLENSRFQVFAPAGDSDDGSGNNQSLSVLAQLPRFSVLATGDMDMETELRLLSSHSEFQADILVAGHHGSKSSTSPTLLRRLSPAAVVISVGDNRYGHPAEETIQRIEESGAAIYRTDQSGNIRFKGELPWQKPIKETATSS